MQEAHDPYAALRLHDYRCLLGGGVLSTIGGEMQGLAASWELFERTGSAAVLGLAGLVQFLPVLLFSLPAGHFADRFSRKRQVQAAQGVMALASLNLAVLSLLDGPVPLVYLCLFLTGLSRAFNMPARSSLLPQVVPGHLISNAVTWNSGGMQTAHVAGPALAGLVVAASGSAVAAYLLAANCSLTCIVLIGLIRPQASARAIELPSVGGLLSGIEFVWQTRLLLAAITLDLFAVLLGGATALLPIFAKEILQVDATGLGWLRAAPALGALVMALFLAHRPPLRHAGRTLLFAVAGFGAATIAFGLSHNYWLSLAMLALTGALDNISVVIRHTLMQVLTPDAMRGRVAAVNLVFISSSNELGAFESGMAAEWFGTIPAVVGGGIGTILVVLTAMLRWPQLLALGSLHAARSEAIQEKPTMPAEPEGQT